MKYCNLIAFIFFFSTVHAQKENPPAAATAKDFSLPKKTEKVFTNGLKAVLVPYGKIPKVYVSLIVKTGNVHEKANQIWLSDVVAKMLEQGTTTYTAEQLAKKAAAIGGTLEVRSTAYSFTVSGSALSEHVEELIGLITDVAMHPSFPKSELEKIKGNLKRKLAVDKTLPQSTASEKFAEVIYGKNISYGRLSPTEEMLDAYTIDDVKQFYKNNMGAKRSVVYVAGIFDSKKVDGSIAKGLKNWVSGPAPEYPKMKLPYTPTEVIVNRPSAPQTTVIMGLPVIDPSHPDYNALTLANSLLGGSFGSRITRNIREDKGYTYSPFSSVDVYPGYGSWSEEADITTEHTIAAIDEIKKEIRRLGNEPPSKSELEGIQKYEAGIFVLRNSTPQGIIHQLSFLDIFRLDDSYLSNRVKNIYSVTPQQLSDAVKKYISPEQLSVIMVGDEKLIKEQRAK